MYPKLPYSHSTVSDIWIPPIKILSTSIQTWEHAIEIPAFLLATTVAYQLNYYRLMVVISLLNCCSCYTFYHSSNFQLVSMNFQDHKTAVPLWPFFCSTPRQLQTIAHLESLPDTSDYNICSYSLDDVLCSSSWRLLITESESRSWLRHYRKDLLHVATEKVRFRCLPQQLFRWSWLDSNRQQMWMVLHGIDLQLLSWIKVGKALDQCLMVEFPSYHR